MLIKTHKTTNQRTEKPHFFILSKGNNSGRPMETPCPNCFICIAGSEEEKQNLYWLFYGLWEGYYFKPFITGSVIPFIRIDDVKNVVKQALRKITEQPDKFKKNVSMVQLLNEKSIVIHEQIKLIKYAKRVLMYEVLK